MRAAWRLVLIGWQETPYTNFDRMVFFWVPTNRNAQVDRSSTASISTCSRDWAFCSFIRLCCFSDRILLNSTDWPWTFNPSASASCVLGLQVCTTTPGLHRIYSKKLLLSVKSKPSIFIECGNGREKLTPKRVDRSYWHTRHRAKQQKERHVWP
jgi:hypothetical protein